MRELFRGWRRKVGCMTLVMALVLAGIWVRSFNTFDILVCPARQQTTLVSGNGSIVWAKAWIAKDTKPFQLPKWKAMPSKSQLFFSDPALNINWIRCRFGSGYEYTDAPIRQISSSYWIFPFWSIVMPLTLLSAYLLLSKPRVAKPAAVAEN